MKIGLLTVYYSNYGSYYQAASLAKQLEALGHDCEIVNASIRGKHAINFLLGAAGEHVLPKAVTDQVAKRVTAFRTYHAMRPELDALKIGPLVFSAKAHAKEIVRRYKPFLDEIDLTYTQYIVMMVLWEEREINVKELGSRLYLDSGTLTPVLKRLEQKGLITRQRDDKDERVLIVSSTKEGDELKDKAV